MKYEISKFTIYNCQRGLPMSFFSFPVTRRFHCPFFFPLKHIATLVFFCVFFLIFKFSTKKGFIQSKANGLGFDPQWRYCSKYPDDVTFFDRASIALTFRRRVGASIAQSVERSPFNETLNSFFVP